MKNFCISLICLSIIVLTIVLGAEAPKAKEEYLRIHVRANSNDERDQSVKYAVRDGITEYLTPIVAECKSKEALQNALNQHICGIEAVAEEVLFERGFDYGCSARVTVEQFPTRVYGDLTLEAGYYDALIIELGEGEGNNWWCVVYPPLCFVGNGTGESFRYKSVIAEMISVWREKHGK
ncbi:MAG: stage II sporulation protein R [Clostridia bacterium]|nr:stage II sporulation protein R [Clostridia bacterium]